MPSVLIVDDDAVNRQLLATLLAYDGHEVIEASDGLQALDAVRAGRPALVISDVLMPRMDGYEFARQIRHDPAVADTRVMFYTANYFEREARDLAAACGVTHVLTKPCEPEAILAAVRTALATAPPPAMPGDPGAFDREHLRVMTDKLSAKVQELEAAQAALRRQNEELEARVAERTRQLQHSNEDLEQFAHVASHDLQEPLRTISAYTELLARRYRGRFDTDADEFIDHALAGAARMRALIDDLVAYAGITGGPPPADVPADAALDVALGRLAAAIQGAGAVIEREPLPVVTADAAQLAQVFEHLIDNALKFRGTAPPVVHVSAARGEGEWELAVRDNGIGIDPKDAGRIFIMFRRLHERAAYPGTGIGLAVCRRIVTRLGGRIRVESARGAGSTFSVTLPAPREDGVGV